MLLENKMGQIGNRARHTFFSRKFAERMIEVITRWFNKVFDNQMSPLVESQMKSEINLTIKNKKSEYIFKENTCIDWNSEFHILHQAFYIDNPFIVDYMSDGFIRSNMKATDTHLLRHLCKEEGDVFDGVFDTVIVKDKLDEIYICLENLSEEKLLKVKMENIA